MASFSFAGGGTLALHPPGAGGGGALQFRGIATLSLSTHTPPPAGTFSFDGGGVLLLTQDAQAGATFGLLGGGLFNLHNPLPTRGAFSLDGGGAFLLHTDATPSGWSLDVENAGGDHGAFPALTFQISLADPLALPDWYTIPARVVAFDPTHGRSGEFDDFPAGTGSITLDNQQGYFDRDNNASPIASYLTTNRRVRIVATWNSVDYVVLDQYVDFWPMDDDPTFPWRAVTVTTTDATTFLANLTISPARPFTLDDPDLGRLDAGNLLGGTPAFDATLAGIRIREILELVGWPEELTDIDDGLTAVVADMPANKVWATLQQLARSEMGQLFVTASNVVTFRQRRAWTHIAEQRSPQVIFSDNALLFGLPYTAIALDPGSRALIKNRVTRTATTGATFTAEDLDSQNAYGTVEDSQTDLLTANYAEIAGQCEYVLGRYAQPAIRVTSITADQIEDPDAFFTFALAAEVGWRALVGRTPAIGAPPIVRDCAIESVSHAVTAPQSWSTTWSLLEADLNLYFTLDDPDLGRLDAGNVLAF